MTPKTPPKPSRRMMWRDPYAKVDPRDVGGRFAAWRQNGLRAERVLQRHAGTLPLFVVIGCLELAAEMHLLTYQVGDWDEEV